MNYRQLSDFKIESLEEQIIWKDERKEIIKVRIQENLGLSPKKKRFRLNLEWIKVPASLVTVGLLCFVLISNIADKKSDFQEVHQGDSVYYNWHNFEIIPKLPQADVSWLKLEDYPKLVEINKSFDLKESQKLASFQIMRPTFDINMPLEVSKGNVTYPPSLKMENFKGPIKYFDIWHKGDKWVYAIQSLSEETTKSLNEKGKINTWEIRSNAKVIRLEDKDGIAIVTDEGEDGTWINMYVINKEDKVIYIQIRGNIGETELMKLAKSYVEK